MEPTDLPPCTSRPLGVWFATSHSTSLPQHSHAGVELNLVVAGSIVVDADGERIAATTGQLLVLPAGVPHQMVELTADAALWVVECPNTPSGLAEHQRAAVLFPSPLWTRQLLRRAKKLWQRPQEQKLMGLEGALLELLSVIPEATEGKTPVQHPAVIRAREVCERELAEEPTAEDIARLSGVSASRLAHLFQEQLGVSPIQYRNYVRLQHFLCEEPAPDETVLSRAIRYGFGSYPQFHRIFLQVCGTPPGEHLSWLDARRQRAS